MLDEHLKIPVTRRRLRSGPAADYVDGFADWLYHRAHRPEVIRKKLQSLAAWTDWLRATGRDGTNFAAGLDECRVELLSQSRRRYQRGPNLDTILVARQFVCFMQENGAIPMGATAATLSDTWPLLGFFRSWMDQHRGLTRATMNTYEKILDELLRTLGTDTITYTAEALRGFVLARAKRHGVAYAKMGATVVRSFLRFLGATGRCQPGMEHAIPAFASWKLSAVPRFLPSEDVELMLASCVADACGLRDKAVLLLLARLGLRAGDVAGIKLSDLDWSGGRLAVCGKGGRREFFPLPQEVGDAILRYLKASRPASKAAELFITVVAPFRPVSRNTISRLVGDALRRAGVKSPNYGAHVLRHSAATTMLRQGASLASIGAVLRHRSPQTTAHYAKVDIAALSEIAQAWPGVAS